MENQLCIIHEQKIKTLEEELKELKDTKESLKEISILFKTMQKENEKRDKVVEEQLKTIKEINETQLIISNNLSNLNNEIKDIKERVDKMENNSNINTADIVKKILWIAISFFVGYYLKGGI